MFLRTCWVLSGVPLASPEASWALLEFFRVAPGASGISWKGAGLDEWVPWGMLGQFWRVTGFSLGLLRVAGAFSVVQLKASWAFLGFRPTGYFSVLLALPRASWGKHR